MSVIETSVGLDTRVDNSARNGDRANNPHIREVCTRADRRPIDEGMKRVLTGVDDERGGDGGAGAEHICFKSEGYEWSRRGRDGSGLLVAFGSRVYSIEGRLCIRKDEVHR